MKMPVSLGRRIRRINIPFKEGRAENWKADLSNPFVKSEALQIIKKAKEQRLEARRKLSSRTRKQIRGSRPRRRAHSKKAVQNGKK
jgi:hypothetical protein